MSVSAPEKFAENPESAGSYVQRTESAVDQQLYFPRKEKRIVTSCRRDLRLPVGYEYISKYSALSLRVAPCSGFSKEVGPPPLSDGEPSFPVDYPLCPRRRCNLRDSAGTARESCAAHRSVDPEKNFRNPWANSRSAG
jgi:hypothetical protein